MKMDYSHIRGDIIRDAPLGGQSWFRCGGTADILFHPSDQDDLLAFMRHLDKEAPLTIIGGLANTIIRDGGVRGVTVQLDKKMANVQVMGGCYVDAAAGALNGTVAAAAAKAGIGGLEFLSGIPGSIGGALAMNAGAYGTEMKDRLVGFEKIDRQGKLQRVSGEDLVMSYRHTDLGPDQIITKVLLKGKVESRESVKARLSEIKETRRSTQPITEKTGGSTFANPSAIDCFTAGLPEGTRAWEVVDKVGGRGLRMGGAQMSEKHCNFMLNTGTANAADLEALGEELRRRVQHEFGITLRWEINRIGVSTPE